MPWGFDLLPGINVGNAIKQITTGQDQDIFGGVTNSNRAGQIQMNALPDYGVRPTANGGLPSPTRTPVGTDTGDVLSDQIAASMAPGGGGGAAFPALNQGAVNNTQIALDQLPGLLEAALASERTNRQNTLNEFNAAETGQRDAYGKSTTTNQQNYDGNYMESIRSGIKGIGSLMNILRGTGGSGGTAEDLVRDTVGGVTSNDIRTGADTRDANQGQLDTTLSTFLTELSGKRQKAEDTFTNNERAIRRDNATQMQDLLGKMAGYYGDAGQTARANEFMGRAGGLTPEIASNSQSQVSAYDRTPVAVKAPELTAFAAPSQPNVAVAPDNGQVGSGIFTMNRRREQEQIPTALPVGA